MPDSLVSDELWEQFHTVVNMTSAELRDWLRVQSAGEQAEQVPDRSGTALGRQVLHILGKRREDLTPEDADAMRTVVERVRDERGDNLESTAGDEAWRHRLMGLGHDPLAQPRHGSGEW